MGRHCICKNCGKEFVSRIKATYCSDDCKRDYKLKSLKIYTCEACGNTYRDIKYGNRKHLYCSETCRIKLKNRAQSDKERKDRTQNFSGEDGIDFVECRLCGERLTFLNDNHMKRCHPELTLDDYKKKFPDQKLYSKRHIEKYYAGDNNPRSSSKISEQDIRKSSPFCKEFYESRGLDDSVRLSMVRNFHDRMSPEQKSTTIEYYTSRGFSKEEAIEERRKRNSFTLDKCIKKYGETEGTKVFIERQERWMKTMFSEGGRCKTCTSISSASQEFIKAILGEYIDSDLFKYGSTEYIIEGLEHVYRYDLTCLSNKRIIEYNGDLWHANPILYDETDTIGVNKKRVSDIWEYDREKLDTAKRKGFDVLVIWERDWKYYKDECIKKAKDFIFYGINKPDLL